MLKFLGGNLAVIVTNPLVGFMASSWIGWPSTFYLYGFFGLLWVVSWILLGSDSPAEHKSITVEERRYIEENQETTKEVAVSMYTII